MLQRKKRDVTPLLSLEILKGLHLVSTVVTPLSGPMKVQKNNQTPIFCQISDLLMDTSAKILMVLYFSC